ncbi:MAG: helix-turn-helix transcriptional regulator [Gemmatimonadota bacterium]
MPLGGSLTSTTHALERPDAEPEEASVIISVVLDDWFDVMPIPVVRGFLFHVESPAPDPFPVARPPDPAYFADVVFFNGYDPVRERGAGSDMSHQGLGEFEQMVLLAILRLDGDVYGVRIVDEIEARTGRSVARAAVYVTLRRLERKGLVSSWMGDPLPERGGKPRRFVKVEAAGERLLWESRRAMESMWQGLSPALRETR